MDTKKIKILYAEDNRITAQETGEALEDNGYEVKTVFDGDEAWLAYQSSRPDVVVLDYQMPGKTGIEVFSADEPNIITFHLEACKNKEEVMKNINLIKEKGSRVGIAIKPETPIEKVYEYLPYIHMCLIMTVEPGKGGQTLITDMIAKIDELKTYAEKKSLEIDIEADGGINLKTAERVKNAGANILVAGTAILKAADYKVIIDELKQE